MLAKIVYETSKSRRFKTISKTKFSVFVMDVLRLCF